MQQAHQLLYKLGAGDNLQEGVLSGVTTDAALNSYLSNGWTLQHIQAVGYEAGSIIVFAVVVRNVPAEETKASSNGKRAKVAA